MPRKKVVKPVGAVLYRELRYKVLVFFSEPKVNYDLDSFEPFKTDIAQKRYTSVQVREMVRALHRAGMLLEAPSSSPPSRIVYALTALGRHALNELKARFE